MTEPHALVTGAAGFIGSHLVERLLAEGMRVSGVDAFTDYYDPALKRANLARALESPRFRLFELDLGAADLSALPEVTVVFHQAAQAGVRASWGAEFSTYVHHNVLATQRLLERYQQTRLERFVYASSSSVYGDAERYPTDEAQLPRPFSPYGVTKLAGEHLVLLYGRNFGMSGRRRCATSPSTVRASAPTWRSTSFCKRDAARRSRSRCTATAGSRATSRTSTTPIEANVRAWRRSAPQGRLQHRRRLAGGGRGGDRAARSAFLGREGQGSLRDALPPGDPLRTRADASRACARDLDYTTRVGDRRTAWRPRPRGRSGLYGTGACSRDRRRISRVVVPAYNEAESLPELNRELTADARLGWACRWEIDLRGRRLARRHRPR